MGIRRITIMKIKIIKFRKALKRKAKKIIIKLRIKKCKRIIKKARKVLKFVKKVVKKARKIVKKAKKAIKKVLVKAKVVKVAKKSKLGRVKAFMQRQASN